jgi:hypothetical protein
MFVRGIIDPGAARKASDVMVLTGRLSNAPD